ncbi:uncharacterized protein EAE97_002203 [Botrytis byssoidea]|uniref:Anaphase-promoting complex subunit 11 n=1 Tax=Botrytis byssoidea TaxID=139641 RepID=A0A9P5IXJ5_9HELO|nr:uncharacterized protein EAE97_002203 [Botrytis byssoidea]KAF7950651.1 hypothetical protein EAE97_002203 [Botrytis byssoidea]
MDAFNATEAEDTDHIIFITEIEQGNGAVYLDQYYLLSDDLRILLTDTGVPPELQNEDIPALEEQRIPELANMPVSSEKKDAIRALLKPVDRGTDDLSPCFCNEPYAEATAKIYNNSHGPVKMPDCPHIFGKCCIVKWLGENSPSTCPMCRKVVHLPRDGPVTRSRTDDGYSIIDYHF